MCRMLSIAADAPGTVVLHLNFAMLILPYGGRPNIRDVSRKVARGNPPNPWRRHESRGSKRQNSSRQVLNLPTLASQNAWNDPYETWKVSRAIASLGQALCDTVRHCQSWPGGQCETRARRRQSPSPATSTHGASWAQDGRPGPPSAAALAHSEPDGSPGQGARKSIGSGGAGVITGLERDDRATAPPVLGRKARPCKTARQETRTRPEFLGFRCKSSNSVLIPARTACLLPAIMECNSCCTQHLCLVWSIARSKQGI